MSALRRPLDMTKRKRESESLFARVAIFLLAILGAVSVAAQDLAVDTRALLVFSAYHDPRGTKLAWTNATNTCTWRGITCFQDRVTEVRLPGSGFRGIIPPGSLSLISELRVVSLRNNQLTGPFPDELGKCDNVESLFLAGNAFSGPVQNLSGLMPRLTQLSLEYNRLNGTIPEELGLFSRLNLLNLRNNFFSGSIPSFSFANLTTFDVSYNNLSGQIPASLSKFPVDSYLGNPGLSGCPLESSCSSSAAPITAPGPIVPSLQPSKEKRLSVGAIVGIAVGGVLFLVLIVSFLVFLCGRKKGRHDAAPIEVRELSRDRSRDYTRQKTLEEVDELQAEGYPSVVVEKQAINGLVPLCTVSFDLDDLLRASAEVLGKGTVGTAYKAILEDGSVVVVKRLKDVPAGRKEFEAQIQVLGKLQHRNLVPLRAYYFSRDEKLLVSDFMSMGNLFSLLHGNRSGNSRTPVDWSTRVKIAIGAASGLAHLHAQGGPNFVHGNIKSSNILMSKNLEACLSDYGLAYLMGSSSSSSKLVGYRAPEVASTRRLTHKSDVFSFGVLLLELLTGKSPTQASANNEVIDLPRWVQGVVREEWTAEVFDLSLMRYENIEGELVAMLRIAMQCVDRVPERRPKMTQVVAFLEDVHPFIGDSGDETSRHYESASEHFRNSDRDSSHRSTPYLFAP